MAPSRQQSNAAAPFSKDEKVLCFHMSMLYEAKIMDTRHVDGGWQFKVHYKGWKNTVCASHRSWIIEYGQSCLR